MSTGDFELPKSKAETKKPKQSGTVEEFTTEATATLEKPKFSEEELTRIFDEIIFSEVYTENVDIKGRLKVVFRTRTTEEIETITRKLDSTTANLVATLTEKRSILNLYYALTSYQGKDLSSLKVEDKEKFVSKLPAPIVGALIMALHKFDEKVYEACKEGEENF